MHLKICLNHGHSLFVKHCIVNVGFNCSCALRHRTALPRFKSLRKLCSAIIVNGTEMLQGEGVTDYYVFITVMTVKYHCEYSDGPAICTIVVVI
jgi:hypothetical protein